MFYACGRNLNRKNENIDAKMYRKTASWLSLIENSRRTALVSALVGTCHYVNLFFLLLSPPMTRKSFHLPHHGRFSSPLRSNRERRFLENHHKKPHILLISCFFPHLIVLLASELFLICDWHNEKHLWYHFRPDSIMLCQLISPRIDGVFEDWRCSVQGNTVRRRLFVIGEPKACILLKYDCGTNETLT